MNITLEDVSIIVIEGGSDTVLITPNNVSRGIWPFDGFQLFKAEIAKGKSKHWLKENFGEEVLDSTKFIPEK